MHSPQMTPLLNNNHVTVLDNESPENALTTLPGYILLFLRVSSSSPSESGWTKISSTESAEIFATALQAQMDHCLLVEPDPPRIN